MPEASCFTCFVRVFPFDVPFFRFGESSSGAGDELEDLGSVFGSISTSLGAMVMIQKFSSPPSKNELSQAMADSR